MGFVMLEGRRGLWIVGRAETRSWYVLRCGGEGSLVSISGV